MGYIHGNINIHSTLSDKWLSAEEFVIITGQLQSQGQFTQLFYQIVIRLYQT